MEWPAVTLTLALAVLMGLSLGLFGSGGSIVAMPVLVYVAGVPAVRAVGMSLAIVGGTSLLGAMLNARQGAFSWRAAAFFAASGIPGALVGSRFTHFLSAPVLMLVFGIVMVIVGTRMGQNREVYTSANACRPLRCLTAGGTVGLLTGFLGVGGGFLILPALVLFAGLELKTAIGTSLGVIAMNCLGGLAGQLLYVKFDWGITLGFLAAAVGGMLAGTALTARLPARLLRQTFAIGVMVLGAVLICWNLRTLALTLQAA